MLSSIHVDSVDQIEKLAAEVMEDLMQQHSVPKDKQVSYLPLPCLINLRGMIKHKGITFLSPGHWTAPGACFITKFISLTQVVPSIALQMQNRGLKHHAFLLGIARNPS